MGAAGSMSVPSSGDHDAWLRCHACDANRPHNTDRAVEPLTCDACGSDFVEVVALSAEEIAARTRSSQTEPASLSPPESPIDGSEPAGGLSPPVDAASQSTGDGSSQRGITLHGDVLRSAILNAAASSENISMADVILNLAAFTGPSGDFQSMCARVPP